MDPPTRAMVARAFVPKEETAADDWRRPFWRPVASAPIRNVTSLFANCLPSFIFFVGFQKPLHRKDKEPLGVSYACNRATKVRTSFQAVFKLTTFN